MSADRKTIAVYDTRISDYAAKFDTGEPDAHLERFMALLAPGARVLDLGCGTGNASAHLNAAGFRAEAIDASSEMVAAARAKGVNAKQASFDNLTDANAFGGVWANFSLLHAPRDQIPDLFARIARSLTPGGIFHLGLKIGSGEHRDHLGRAYTYFEPAELTALLDKTGFAILHSIEGKDPGLANIPEPWIVIIANV